MNFSSDLINIIGSNEIESFNKTLNEMLSVWNDPSSTGSNPTNTSTSGQSQLDANINLILNNNNNSNNNNNITTPSINLSSSLFKQSGRSFLTNTTSQLDSFLMENSSLLQGSDDAIGKMSKVINDINRETKEFQPVEIVPIRSSPTNTPSPSLLLNNNTIEPIRNFSDYMPSFTIDNSKIEELKSDISFLDPILSIPYHHYSNNTTSTTTTSASYNSNNIYNNTNHTNNNNNYNNNNIINFSNNIQVKQENYSGPIRQYDNRSDRQPETTLVTLTPGQLSSFTSTEMDTYAKVTNVSKDLSNVERKDLKRQKRLIKNRESAHLSRQRKRERLTDLEHRVEELTQNSSTLTKTLGGLENENLVLKAEVEQLVDVIRDSPALSTLFYSMASKTGRQQQHNNNKSMVGAY